ncbi:MAG: T9SS type A sorting domain-containing protein [Bacteroidetes bacterium]|nr:T9SS type A sorting domain-containing protein [Bacteroidota bacterium]
MFYSEWSFCRTKTITVQYFPNPNNGSFTFEYPSIGTNDGLLEIFDMMGHLVNSTSLPANQNRLNIPFGHTQSRYLCLQRNHW